MKEGGQGRRRKRAACVHPRLKTQMLGAEKGPKHTHLPTSPPPLLSPAFPSTEQKKQETRDKSTNL